MTGTIDFSDAGANVSTLHLSTSGGAVLTVAVPLPGVTQGTLQGDFSVSVDQTGHYTFEIWLEDSAGHTSNHLAGTFDVLVNDSASSWREIPLENSDILLGAAWNGSLYVAVGQGGVVMTSADALTWTRQQLPPTIQLNQLSSVAWSGSIWAAVGYSAQKAAIVTSADGVVWSVSYQTADCSDPSTCPPQQALAKIIWDGTQFVSVGHESAPGSSPTALIMTSPDGVTWTQRATGAIPVGSDEGLGMASVASSGSVLVAAGQAADGTAAVWTSPDAVSWTRQGLPLAGQRVLRDIAWGPSGFVAVGWGGSPATASSADGLSWQANQDAVPLSAMNAIAAGPTKYLAVSNTSIETTAGGMTWVPSPTTRPCGNAVLWDGRRWVSFAAEVCLSP
ncbi:MAG: hypothetical protein JSR36_01835 [Proteobacteria bacterium]|nr:hypothetical protein [Pseudomonadota bacterium]